MFTIQRATILMLLSITSVTFAQLERISWVKKTPDKLISSAQGFENVTADNLSWQATVTDPVYPKVFINDIDIDADANKYLYIKLQSSNRDYLRIYFSDQPQNEFYNLNSFTSSQLHNSNKPVVYRMNLSQFEHWKGDIKSFKIFLHGKFETDIVKILGIGVSKSEISQIRNLEIIDLPIGTDLFSNDRMAAWRNTIISTNDTFPNTCLMTYIKNRENASHDFLLAKLVPGINSQTGKIWSDEATNAKAKDLPGSAIANFLIENTKIQTEAIPLFVGDNVSDWEGAMLYEIKADGNTPLVVRCGSGGVFWKHTDTSDTWTTNSNVDFKGSKCRTEGKFGFMTNPAHPQCVGIATSGKINKISSEKSEYFEVSLNNGSGYILVTYSKEFARTKELLNIDADIKYAEVKSFYNDLMDNRWIETPDANMNRAFETAITTLEYCWYPPYGWIEGIHHWLSMWHMQHSGAAELLGQEDRSRDCLITMSENLYEGNAAPQFHTSENAYRSFGGSSQFYLWQIDQYLTHTNDTETIKLLTEPMDAVIKRTYAEYDLDEDYLLSWGHQIGNQEDLVATPYDGTSPTIEGINMMKTRARVARALGDEETNNKMLAKIAQAKKTLKQELWMNDLGRFMYYKDPFGKERLDGQYQTYSYPAIWGITDSFDSWSTMRHFRDRLMGDGGEVYCSNNFADHLLDIFATWGMQAGAAQQPWGAWALASVGLNNETFMPLKAVANWVNGDLRDGNWPEVANEIRPGYFSPPAGLYIHATVEALYGLILNKHENRLIVSPSFPDHWDDAKLKLPHFTAQYLRNGNTLRYNISTTEAIKRSIEWKLPSAQVQYVKVNNKKIPFNIQSNVNYITLNATTDSLEDSLIEIKYKPLKYKANYPASIAQNDTFKLDLDGLTIKGIDDRYGIFSNIKITGKNALEAKVKGNLLDEYLKYGQLGQMNFSRRSFFVSVMPKKGPAFWLPIDIAILPEYEAAQTADLKLSARSSQASIKVNNNTFSAIEGKAKLKFAGATKSFTMNIAPRSNKEFSLNIPTNQLSQLSCGNNTAILTLPNYSSLEFTINIPKTKDIATAKNDTEIIKIDLPKEDYIDDTQWLDIRKYFTLVYRVKEIFTELENDQTTFTAPELPEIDFKINGRKFIPVSQKTNRPTLTVDLDPYFYKKIYVLLVPFIDNHDMFSEVARISLTTNDKVAHPQVGVGKMAYTLRCPGDFDMYPPYYWMAHLGTHNGPRNERFDLLPQLSQNDGDWSIAKPPVFPQRKYWAKSIPISVGGAVMNIIEIDLKEPKRLSSIDISVLGVDSALGILGVSVDFESI